MKNFRKIFSTIILLSIVSITYSQLSFSNDAGLGIYITNFNSGFAFAYSPRMNFLEIREISTLSVGTHLAVGSSFRDEETEKNYLMYDIPLVLELNIGNGSKSYVDIYYGASFGVGYGINYLGGSELGAINSSGLILVASAKTGIFNIKSSYLTNDQFLGSDVLNVSFLFQIRKREKRNTYSKKSPYQK